MKRYTFILLGMSLLIPGAYAWNQRLSRDLDTTKGDTIDVIVQYKAPAAEKNGFWATRRSGRLKRALANGLARVYSIGASDLDDLAEDPDIEFVTPDRQ